MAIGRVSARKHRIEKQKQRREQGICPKCGKLREWDNVFCRRCTLVNRKRNRIYRSKRKWKYQDRSNGKNYI